MTCVSWKKNHDKKNKICKEFDDFSFINGIDFSHAEKWDLALYCPLLKSVTLKQLKFP